MPPQPEMEVHWDDDGFGAVFVVNGGWRTRLEAKDWWPEGERKSQLAWVVSWVARDSERPEMLEAMVELPALVADGDPRREELVRAAIRAMQSRPEAPQPSGAPSPTPATPDEWADHLDLQITCWDYAYRSLLKAADERAPRGEFMRYRALTDALERIYTVDSSLKVLWGSLKPLTQERLSIQTDAAARRAAEHNARILPGFDIESSADFAAYLRRQDDHQPYRHWGDLLLAGLFQRKFFHAIGWVRGQLIHAATSAPLDLRQWRPGTEPRFKWRESELFARGRADDAGRRAYDQLLAGQDVLGLLGHLTDVFVDARRLLTTALREETAARTEAPA